MSDFILNTGPLDPEAIAALAYRLWQQRGCPAGSGEEDWLRAEAMLRAESLRRAEVQPAAHAATPRVARQPARKTQHAPQAASTAAPRKTRVSRARPARPDA